MKFEDYRRDYDSTSLRSKVRRFGRRAGRELVELVLQLYYAVRAPETPTWAKGVIYGALGYFITPLDALPDFTPLAGFSDDFAVLTAAVTTVALYITPAIKLKARAKLDRWIGTPQTAPASYR